MRYLFAILGLTALDQALKAWAREALAQGAYVELIPNFIHLTYQENRGISFSLLADLPDSLRAPLLAGVSLAVILGLGVYCWKQRHSLPALEAWGYSLILAGALGNLIDRAWRQSVTDYMFFHWYDQGFFVNNLADDLISIGFVLVLWAGFRSKEAA